MKKRIILLLILLLTSIVFSNPIDIETAKKVAINWFSVTLNKPSNSYIISENFIIKENNKNIIYIFNINLNSFIIVAADDKSVPILGYSYESIYNPDKKIPAFDELIELYKKQILFAINNNIEPLDKTLKLWDNLKASSFILKKEEQFSDVAPLLSTKWGQGKYYNALCPIEPNSKYDNHVPVGCVATAIGQIMKYWNYPEHGYGKYSYNHSKYGTQRADFENTYYQWNNMPDYLTSSNNAVALLLYHCGVALKMSYGPSGSGTILFKGPLEGFFNYSSKLKRIVKESYSDSMWIELLKEELNNKRPIYYCGIDTLKNGHAYVCDGYQNTNYFHINWGWSGSYNGYFYLNNLNPNDYNFGSSQYAYIGIYPDDGSNICEDTTWESNIEIKEPFMICAGINLTLSPGVEVKIKDDCDILCYGSISAEGSSEKKIIFTALDQDLGWKGITFGSSILLADNESVSDFSNCVFMHNENSFQFNKVNVNLINCSFEKISGIRFNYCNANVINSIFKNKYSLTFYYSGGTVINCLISDCQSDGIRIIDCSPLLINNTICNNKYDGIQFYGNSTSRIINTIIFNNAVSQANLSGDRTNTDEIEECNPNFYNCDIQDGVEGFDGDGLSTYSGDYLENINANPEFVICNSYLYQLSASSPCIDKGTDDVSIVSLPEIDLIGNPRVYNGKVDIGAYEWCPTTQIVNEVVSKLDQYSLFQNYPNPFNPVTTIKYELPKTSQVSLRIYNVLGQEVKTLINDKKQAGVHQIKWDGTNNNGIKVNSGIYLYRLQAGSFIETKKMILLK